MDREISLSEPLPPYLHSATSQLFHNFITGATCNKQLPHSYFATDIQLDDMCLARVRLMAQCNIVPERLGLPVPATPELWSRAVQEVRLLGDHHNACSPKEKVQSIDLSRWSAITCLLRCPALFGARLGSAPCCLGRW